MPKNEPAKPAHRFACQTLMPGCNFVATGDTESEVLARVAEHAKQQHGIAQVTPELAEKVKAAMVHQ